MTSFVTKKPKLLCRHPEILPNKSLIFIIFLRTQPIVNYHVHCSKSMVDNLTYYSTYFDNYITFHLNADLFIFHQLQNILLSAMTTNNVHSKKICNIFKLKRKNAVINKRMCCVNY